MSRIKRITVTLFSLREAAHSSILAHLVETVLASCQNLMRIRLVSDVPDQSVFRQIQRQMQCHGQFDDAQIGCQMSAVCADLFDQKIPDFLCQLRQFFFLDLFDIVYLFNLL